MKISVTTYAELARWADAFAKGHFDAFILVGNPGLGKTRTVKDRVGTGVRLIEGRTSAFQLFCELYKNKDKPFLIDDVDALYSDKDAVRLLKCLCQTEKVKTLAWHSATPKLDQEGIPHEFSTKSKVAIIANVWKDLNTNIEAVNDRGILIRFRPNAHEVHRWVASWYQEQKVSDEVYDFIGNHLALIREPSGRHYVTARQVKDAGLNWKAALYETWNLDTKGVTVLTLLRDGALTSKRRVQLFNEQTGGSRATFYRLAKDLRHAAGADNGPSSPSPAPPPTSSPSPQVAHDPKTLRR